MFEVPLSIAIPNADKTLKNQEDLNSILIFLIARLLKHLRAVKETAVGRAGLKAELRLMKHGCCSQLLYVRLGKISGAFLHYRVGLNVKKMHKHENRDRLAFYVAGHGYYVKISNIKSS